MKNHPRRNAHNQKPIPRSHGGGAFDCDISQRAKFNRNAAGPNRPNSRHATSKAVGPKKTTLSGAGGETPHFHARAIRKSIRTQQEPTKARSGEEVWKLSTLNCSPQRARQTQKTQRQSIGIRRPGEFLYGRRWAGGAEIHIGWPLTRRARR